MRKWIPFIACLLAVPVMAQPSNPSIIVVTQAPSGACGGSGLPMRYLFSTGVLYACQNGTWGQIGGGGGGPYLPLAGGTVSGPIAFSGSAGANTYTNLVGIAGSTGIVASPNCGGQSNCYPVHDDGQIVWGNATYSNGSPNITCTGCTFVAGDVGKIFFATNSTYQGYYFQLTSVPTCNSTILTVTDSTHVVLNANCTANSIANTPIIWGSDDSTLLATAWTANVTSCGTLQLPGENAQGNGPAVMLIQQQEFNTPIGTPTRANCAYGTEALRSGLGVQGVNEASTVIVPTPGFDISTCTYGLSTHGCLFSINDGAVLRHFTVWGGGNSSPTGATASTVMTDLNAQEVVSATSGNNTLDHIVFMGWGGGTNGLGYGIRINGGTTLMDGVTVDGAGKIGIYLLSGYAAAVNTEAWDNWSGNLLVSGGTFSSTSGYYGFTLNATIGCDVAAVNNGIIYSTGDLVGVGLNPGVGQNGYCVGAGNGNNPSGTGIIYATGVNTNIGNGSGIYVASSGSKFYLSSSQITGSTYGVYNVGHFYNLGGNTLTGSTSAYTCASCNDQVSVAASVGSISGAVGGFYQGEPSPNSGGNFSGQFTSGTSGTITVTITPGQTAPHGWFCRVNDITTPADAVQQTASSTTTCTVSGTTVSSDTILWGAVAN